jgi:hypothetical protein
VIQVVWNLETHGRASLVRLQVGMIGEVEVLSKQAFSGF